LDTFRSARLFDRLFADLRELGLLKRRGRQRTVWAQQYEVRETTVIFRDLHGDDGTTQIQTPHDPEARWSKKRDQTWVGDKLQSARPMMMTCRI
ncbi:hypothetical protein K2Z83_28550, partial [Oscillochloris sp. ZM17-4]|nr:hypothetical protein [Oscillochloris sp. ZM17-4]